MILVDTGVWIDYFHGFDPEVTGLLRDHQVVIHPMVIAELATGSIRQRRQVLADLATLRVAPMLSHSELMAFIETRVLWGKGVGVIDIHLLGSCLLEAGLELHTRDKPLVKMARQLGVLYLPGDAAHHQA